MDWPSVSVIVRTLNEERRLRNLLNLLRKQEYEKKVEIIVVDNESVDGTVEVSKKFGAKIVTIPRDEFSFPKSMNLGAAEASNDILIFTVGHALPKGRRWLKFGMQHFSNEKIAGVYSRVIPHKFPGYPKRTLAEIFTYYPVYFHDLIKGVRYIGIDNLGMGIFGATNCALRKKLWLERHFDERFELGGEDGEWAKWVCSEGYKIVCDPKFTVYHSHGLGSLGLIRQMKYWSKLGGPTTFDKNEFNFRQDLDFSQKPLK